jgi:hypothetical protein
MHDYLPDYLIREQMAVSALVTFGVLRVLAAALLWRRGWEAAWADKAGIAAALLYCAPQLFGLLSHSYFLPGAMAELEGKMAGCAIALFGAPILSHRLGYE